MTPYNRCIQFHDSEDLSEIYAMENDLESDIESIVPQTLQDAMMDFILTGLQRHISPTRGEKMNKHHTMLVHISRLNVEQHESKKLLEKLFELWKSRANSVLCWRGFPKSSKDVGNLNSLLKINLG